MNPAKLTTVFCVLLACGCEHARDPAPNKEFRDCADCPEMVAVPSGRFVMGGASADEPSERPQHEVSVRAFAMGKFDVTRAQWAEFVTATNHAINGGCEWAGFPDDDAAATAAASWRNLGFEQRDDHPAVCVSWNDAQDYLRWLSKRAGHIYRLPTEAEWEYAARAGSTSAYPWGATASHDHANYGSDECCEEFTRGRDQWLYTSPVGSFPPNVFGLFDMHGNAWQWVQDCYADSYAGAPTDGSAHDEANCQLRVLRGGTWGDPPELLRSATRNCAPPPPERWNPQWDYRSGGVGFRVARDL